MATPTENMLLLQQLFQRPAQEFAQASDARTNLAFKLAAMQREEQLKRDLANQQAQREDARNRTTLEFHREQNASQERRATSAATEADRKQTAANAARDKADILNEFDRDYAKYVDASEAAKRPVKKREDFPETRAGLGQMQAETASATRAYQENLLKQAATTGAQRLQRIQTTLKSAVEREAELSKPTPEDEKIARAQATATIKKAITNDINREYEQLTPAQKTKGLAAIAAGDLVVAAEHLGAEVVNAYDALFTQTLMALPSMKARMQEKSIAARQRQEIQSVYEKADAAYSSAAGTNPFVGEQLDKMTPLQMIQATPAAVPKSDEEKLRARIPAQVANPNAPKTPNSPATSGGGPPTMGFGGRFGGTIPTQPSTGQGFGFGGVPIPAPRPPVPMINIPGPVYGPSAAPLIDIQTDNSQVPMIDITSPAPVPMINIQSEQTAYPSFVPSTGKGLVDSLIRRPIEREFNTYENIYQGDVPADAQNRRLQALMQILHGGEYTNERERAIARSQLYQLLGMNPGGN